MLSVLIPVYNYDARPIIRALEKEINGLSFPVEILVMDDQSDEAYTLYDSHNFNHLKYKVLVQNLGRSKIRNLLAEKASHKYLLFIDVDSLPVHTDFLKSYMDAAEKGYIVCGGTNYTKIAPIEREKYFRWFYGHNRESIDIITRKQNGFRSFMSNNFLIAKEDFHQIQFNENLSQYGHEDTLFGLDAEKAGLQIKHIDNPVYHTGLEDTNIFLNKSKKAIENLVLIEKQFPEIIPQLKDSIKLYRWYKQIQKRHLVWPIKFGISFFIPFIKRNIKSQKPKLKLFDIWKLYYILKSSKTIKKL